jgi:hypothetical protein
LRDHQAVADVIRTTLGPRSMLKMILDPMGGIVMTNDGYAAMLLCRLFTDVRCLQQCDPARDRRVASRREEHD